MARRKTQTSIQDVARAASVSIMTVSRAIRGIEGVSERKRTEILQIARKLNYTPNSNARSLVVANSNLVGISLPTFAGEVFGDILKGMRGMFDQAGYSSVIDTTEYSRDAELSWITRLLSWQPAAVILTGTDHHPDARDMLRHARVPVLEIWDYTDDPIDLSVGIDHCDAGFQIGEFAFARGYQNPAFVGMPPGYDTRADARVQGLHDAFQGFAVEVAQTTIANAFMMGFDGTKTLLAQGRPDVIFYLNDHMAFGGIMACNAAGLTVPDDIGITGFNALDLTHVLPQPLTTVSTPRRLMGMTGARALLARINGVENVESTALPVKIIPGKTLREITAPQ